MSAAGHGLYRRLWAVRACSAQWRLLIRSLATPPTSGDIQIERGGGPIQYNQPWLFDWENTLILVATGHGLYCRLWAARICSAQWRALIWSWATPPTTGDIQIKWEGKPIQYNQLWICAQLGGGTATAAGQWQPTA